MRHEIDGIILHIRNISAIKWHTQTIFEDVFKGGPGAPGSKMQKIDR